MHIGEITFSNLVFPCQVTFNFFDMVTDARPVARFNLTAPGVASFDTGDDISSALTFSDYWGDTKVSFDVNALFLQSCSIDSNPYYTFDLAEKDNSVTYANLLSTVYGGTSSPGGSATVDLTPVLNAVETVDAKLNIFTAIVDKLNSLDIQIPDDLATKLENLSTQVSTVDLSSLANFKFIDKSLNGNISRYRDGQEVKVANVVGEFKVDSSVFVRSDSNAYTVIYRLLRKDDSGSFSEVHYVPEALVYIQSEVEAAS